MLIGESERWFSEKLETLPQSDEVKAYVVGVFSRYVVSVDDELSRESLVLVYDKALQAGDFAGFQRIGDWVLWVRTFASPSIRCEPKLVDSLGQASYSACHRIMRGQWKVYEELSLQLPILTAMTRARLKSL